MMLSQDYSDMIELFNIHEVKYLLVGAYAMTVFGYARSTYDIDLWISKEDENITRVLNALADFGVPFEVEPSDIKMPNSIIQIGVAPNRIDILTDIDGVDFDAAWETKVDRNIGELKVYIASLDILIKNKEASSRGKDQIDAMELKVLKKRLSGY